MLTEIAHFFRILLPVMFVPPTGLLWLLILGAILHRRRRRLARALFGIGLVGLYALAMPAVDGELLMSLERAPPTRADMPAPGAIIVLGGDGERTQDLLVKAVPGALSLQRLAGAAVLERQTHLPVLITGGSIASDQPAVADLMADIYTAAFGLPVEWRETKAGNTCENARFSAAILRQAGISSAYVVTNAWHMPRALLSFKQAGFPVVAAPLYAGRHEIQGLADFLPHTIAWNRSYYAIHEWIGLFAYRIGSCQKTWPTGDAAIAPEEAPPP
jgi:uncharacterized SAM-binding protein YcdF (DUF218 family)